MGFLKSILDYFNSGEPEGPAHDLGRNDPCWCGSGKKYKKCHLREDEKKPRKRHTRNCGPA